MKLPNLLAIAMLAQGAAHAQTHWLGINLPGNYAEVAHIFPDTSTNSLYFCGPVSIDGDFDFSDQGMFSWNGIIWDTIAGFNNTVQGAIRWNDTLIIWGGFTAITGDTVEEPAWYNGQQWLPFGHLDSLGGIVRLKIIDGDLYAVGTFDYLDGNLCNGIAKRVGGQWVSVGPIITTSSHNVADLTKYNGQLVACGGISFSGNPYRNIMIQDPDSSWSPVGPQGLIGNFSYGRAVTVYQGDLYVGGSIPLLAGNAGHGLMRWDGSQWNDVGGGVLYSANNYAQASGALDFLERDGLLYVAGSFNYVGGDVPASGVATWDGSQWCGLGGTLKGPVNSIAFYNDTLYSGCHIYADSIDVNCAAKFIGNTYADTCSAPVGLVEFHVEDQPAPMQVFQQAHGTIALIPGISGKGSLRFFDSSGCLVHGSLVTAQQGQQLLLTIPQVALGLYSVQLSVGQLQQTAKLFLKR